ncbi:hypothetical protein [Paenibacillus wulumuqiensis]|uniref:hypothetical protein n=1 Tax=Paenibacillus wulumuqiensis TaxID=1567107 RepID=UPI0006195826|nr:hypothetical protein [Paenibacillus wulumuqiensis]
MYKRIILAVFAVFLGLDNTYLTNASAGASSGSEAASISNVAVFQGHILSWDNGQGYAVFSAAFKPTKILIKNYSSRPVYYRITINEHTIVNTKTLGAGQFVYEKVSRPLLISSDNEYTVRAFTKDSSTRKVYVRAVGIRQ